ncbi:MAG: Hypothetical protein AJITA_00963 [Acetilactobacillus jinshanensis]
MGCCHLKGGLVNVGKHLKEDVYQYFRPSIFTDHALISLLLTSTRPDFKAIN